MSPPTAYALPLQCTEGIRKRQVLCPSMLTIRRGLADRPHPKSYPIRDTVTVYGTLCRQYSKSISVADPERSKERRAERKRRKSEQMSEVLNLMASLMAHQNFPGGALEALTSGEPLPPIPISMEDAGSASDEEPIAVRLKSVKGGGLIKGKFRPPSDDEGKSEADAVGQKAKQEVRKRESAVGGGRKRPKMEAQELSVRLEVPPGEGSLETKRSDTPESVESDPGKVHPTKRKKDVLQVGIVGPALGLVTGI